MSDWIWLCVAALICAYCVWRGFRARRGAAWYFAAACYAGVVISYALKALQVMP